LSRLIGGQNIQRVRHQRREILDGIACGNQDDDSEINASKVLLILKIVIGSHERREPRLGGLPKQCAILCARPTLLLNGPDLVTYEIGRQLARQLLIDQNAHGNSAPRAQPLELPRLLHATLMGTNLGSRRAYAHAQDSQ